MVTEATVAVTFALVRPAPTVTLEGTVTLLFPLVSVTANPPTGAAALSVAVHVEVPGALTVAGVQLSEFRAGRTTVIVPPVPAGETWIPVPEGSEMLIPEMAIGIDGPTVVGESWKEA